jgi:hypothetical protein
MDQTRFQIVAIVAARKAEFFAAARSKLLASLPPSVDPVKASEELRDAVAALENVLFIGPRERRTGVVDPSSSVSSLGLDASLIERRLKTALTRRRHSLRADSVEVS